MEFYDSFILFTTFIHIQILILFPIFRLLNEPLCSESIITGLKMEFDKNIYFTEVNFSLHKYYKTRISGPDGPLILAVDLRNTPKLGLEVVTDGRTDPHTALYI